MLSAEWRKFLRFENVESGLDASSTRRRFVPRVFSGGRRGHKTNREVREKNQAGSTSYDTSRCKDAGRQDFLLATADCNDILERCAANRVVAPSCVCYQQEEAGRDSARFLAIWRIDAAETPRCDVPVSTAARTPYGNQITKPKPRRRGKTSKTSAESQIPWRVAPFIYGSAPMGRQQAAKHDGRRKDRPATFPNVSRNIYRNRLTRLSANDARRA